jgi:fucose 4-O-acetylase-like acetyltransferase
MNQLHFLINQIWNRINNKNQAAFMSERRHDLDALRSFAMLLGLALHASFSFFSAPWPVHDSSQNILIGLVYVAIHGFRMQLFFLLSGFFTMLLFRRRGMKSLLKQRLARIVLPLVVGCATIIPTFEIISKAAIQINPQEPLVASILSGQLESVRDQLKNKEIASSEDHIFHYTMLEWAAMHGSPETISLLVQAGTDVNR